MRSFLNQLLRALKHLTRTESFESVRYVRERERDGKCVCACGASNNAFNFNLFPFYLVSLTLSYATHFSTSSYIFGVGWGICRDFCWVTFSIVSAWLGQRCTHTCTCILNEFQSRYMQSHFLDKIAKVSFLPLSTVVECAAVGYCQRAAYGAVDVIAWAYFNYLHQMQQSNCSGGAGSGQRRKSRHGWVLMAVGSALALRMLCNLIEMPTKVELHLRQQ